MASRRSNDDYAGMRRQYTSAQQSELVDLVTAGGATVPEAAARLEVTESTAYNWVAKAAKLAPRARHGGGPSSKKALSVRAPRFIQLVGGDDCRIEVRIGGAEIQVRRGFDVQLLQAVVEALSRGEA